MSTCPSLPPDDLAGDPIRLHRLDEKWCVVDLAEVLPDGETVEAAGLEVSFWEWLSEAWTPADGVFMAPEPEPLNGRSVRFKIGPVNGGADSDSILAVAVHAPDSGGGKTYSAHRLFLSGMAAP